MKVTFVGEINVEVMTQKLVEIAQSTIERLEKEHQAKINGHSIHEVDLQIKFDVEGMDEPQMLTVDHNGVTEPFQWIVDLNEGKELTNEHESMFDEYSKAMAQGEEHQFKEVESLYNDADLLLEHTETFGDMKKEFYSVAQEDYKVVRIYQAEKLIQEYKLLPRQGAE